MTFRIEDINNKQQIQTTNPNNGLLEPSNILITASVGFGKSLCGEQLAHLFYRNGYTIISLSDVKDGIEFGFGMFKPQAPYHLQKLKEKMCPIEAIPTKIYHPFTFDLPKNQKLPDIQIYTIDIKKLNRTELGFLAEAKENKRSIQILIDTIQKLNKEEGIHHLIFKAEEQTESQANIMRQGIKFRSDNPDDFFTRSKIGTEKTSGEMSAYFKPFLNDYSITPSNCPYNLNMEEIINDQKHYHIFTTKWIRDRRLKAFYIIHLLTQIIENETHAKNPICIYLEEIRFLTPSEKGGFTDFLAEELKNTMTRMRNMGKGYAIISTTQVYRDVHTSVLDSFNENIFGKITSLKELEFIAKTLRLPTQDVNLLKSLETGEFIIRAKEHENSDEATLQKVKFFMPPHAHKEGRYNFFEFYEQHHPEKLRTYKKEHEDIQRIKEEVIESVSVLKDKENISKKDAIKKEREEKLEKEKLRLKLQIQKVNKDTQKAEAINDKLKELIYQEWKNVTGRDKSTRNIAKKFNILLSNGEPNSMAISRALNQMKKKYETETEENETETEPDDDEDQLDTYEEKPEREDP